MSKLCDQHNFINCLIFIVSPFIFVGSIIGAIVIALIIIVIVVAVLIMRQERVGSFRLNGNNKTKGGDDETVNPHTGDGIELSRKGMSELKSV